jgi:gamma-glutamyl hercynylcysteine S-oxide synthase
MDALLDARRRTLALALDLDDAQWTGLRTPTTNPLAWELGHIAWFQEKWLLRQATPRAPLLANADALFDSSRVDAVGRHDLRRALPRRETTLAYLDEVLSAVLAEPAGRRPYFVWLCLCHEDMHGETMTYRRQTLAQPPPLADAAPTSPPAGPLAGDAEIPGCEFELGAARDRPDFVFDNEKWRHAQRVAPYRIARAAVTNREFAAFVDEAGYARDDLWSADGVAWRTASAAESPAYWERRGSRWWVRRFDRMEPLPLDEPIMHVSWYEAEAYCRWARRRLPTEAEWELAATSPDGRALPWSRDAAPSERANLDARNGGPVDVGACPAGDSPYGCRQMIGNVWEWTATRFAPYPGFVADPYADYSAPWFVKPHMVLRGGSWATRERLLRNTLRNFYPPHRRDIFAGFRTCALVP